jgi:tRNA-Thr(GGU) m(6)t(6)A37 methyltransferase TsaA
MNSVGFQLIGIIHSPFKDLEGIPIQPSSASGIEGLVEIFPPYIDGLQDLDGFSHIILLYHFHESDQVNLVVTPFLDSKAHGIFATRAPTRPNPIGLSIVKLERIEHDKLYISNVDILDGTPLLDIKPYIPEFDQQQDVRVGWLSASVEEIRSKVSDDRFNSKKGLDA